MGTAKPDCSIDCASQVTDIEQHVSLGRLFERRGELGLWNFVGRCALQRRASCAWAFEWVSWCRFISVGAVCHGSCILHREDNRPHTVQAECLRPTSILGLLAVCSLRADKQARFATNLLSSSCETCRWRPSTRDKQSTEQSGFAVLTSPRSCFRILESPFSQNGTFGKGPICFWFGTPWFSTYLATT